MRLPFRSAPPRLGFAARLVFAVLASFALAGAGGYGLISRQIEQRVISGHVKDQRADARSFAAIGLRRERHDEIVAEIDEVLRAIHRRPGTLETLLIDERGVVRAAGGDAGAVGEIDRDARIDAALTDGKEYAGREADETADTRDLEFVMPIEVDGKRYAYEVTLDHKNLDGELRGARHGLLYAGLLMFLLGSGAFYVAGGRSLLRSHRLALHRATRDGLTDLPNQRAFHQDLPAAVKTATRHGDPLVLMLLDADDFKFLNDRHGHPYGDEVLRRIADVLRDGRAGDTCYRIGGDEFALLLPRTDAVAARSRSRRLMRALGAANVLMSVGVAELQPGRGADLLRREADAALYEAKRRGGNSVVHVEDVRSEVVITTSQKLDAIHRLLDEQRLEVAYQPIWNLEASELLVLEALARPHADYGFDGPAEAFDLAEQVGRVPQLDKLCFARAVEIAPRLPEGALLFVNLSPLTLDVCGEDEDWLSAAIEAVGLAPSRVVIEVTERFGGRTAGVVKCLRRLREQGFRLALDDVGTGNSGLEMLRLVDAEFVKLDRSIVTAAPDDANARAVLLAMATFASHTGAFVIAEGIEDEDVLEFIRHIHQGEFSREAIIGGGQGYGLGRPSTELDLAPAPAFTQESLARVL
jgi:diguanylate cyclase (GGDEF)-like protein